MEVPGIFFISASPFSPPVLGAGDIQNIGKPEDNINEG
jgi:hypothetical protein